MKKYLEPEMTVLAFDVEDVVSFSQGSGENPITWGDPAGDPFNDQTMNDFMGN